GSKKNKKDINEYKADEYEGGIESNDMLLNENKTPLEIFKANKDKISYCKKSIQENEENVSNHEQLINTTENLLSESSSSKRKIDD
ncbi:38047_t:CDS:2, partial [Gigaspora margarita]